MTGIGSMHRLNFFQMFGCLIVCYCGAGLSQKQKLSMDMHAALTHRQLFEISFSHQNAFYPIISDTFSQRILSFRIKVQNCVQFDGSKRRLNSNNNYFDMLSRMLSSVMAFFPRFFKGKLS